LNIGKKLLLALVFSLFVAMLVFSTVSQAIGAENSILYLHSGKSWDWSGTLDYNPPTRNTGKPIKAETTGGSEVYVFGIQADFDTTIPEGLYIFNLWIKADNDQRIIISLGCRSQTTQINLGGLIYEVKKNTEITKYSFDYPLRSLQEYRKLFKGEWFYTQISLGTGLTLYIDHQSTPSSIITPTPIAIPEFPNRTYILLIGVITYITLCLVRKRLSTQGS